MRIGPIMNAACATTRRRSSFRGVRTIVILLRRLPPKASRAEAAIWERGGVCTSTYGVYETVWRAKALPHVGGTTHTTTQNETVWRAKTLPREDALVMLSSH